MMTFQQFTRSAVFIQGLLWAGMIAVLFIILPLQGFSSFSDFNDAGKIATVLPWMHFLNWSDLLFAFILLLVVVDMHFQLKTRLPILLRYAATTILFGAALWFVLHDLGFHILSWSAIEQDPISTDFAMDRLLWSIRNTIFFAAGLLATILNKEFKVHSLISNP